MLLSSATNLEFKGKFFNEDLSIDYAKDISNINITEQCNTAYGYKNHSRLCHTCGTNFRRKGLHQCNACPENIGINITLIVLGIIIGLLILIVLVKMTITESGKTALSESIQKCILNYFQVASLFGKIPVRWPKGMQNLFDFYGVFSTIGEHLLSPDCTTDIKPYELFYAKQIAYLFVPLALYVLAYIMWKLYAMKTGLEWSRPKSNTNSIRTKVNVKDKFVVTVCVLIYLLYPSLALQAFGLFSCYKLNNRYYLLADLEEDCYGTRHQIYVYLVGVPQLLLFVVGLPIVGFYFLYRNHDSLDTIPVRARYGK